VTDEDKTPRARDGRSYVIRDARDDERDVIRDLVLRAYAEFESIMEPSAWRSLSAAVHSGLRSEVPVERIVADDNGTVIGSAMLYAAASNVYLDESRKLPWPEVRLVSVAPEARGRGVARALMNECVRRARAAGATALGIHTSRSFQTALKLYRDMGFVRDPAHDFEPPGAELVEGYVLPLPSQ
jgi:GNAT superfamily N-acetyltransferase